MSSLWCYERLNISSTNIRKMKLKHLLYTYISFFCLLTSCSNDETTDEPDIPIRRTIITYICGENGLSELLMKDLNEMTEGSKSLPKDCRLVVFADFENATPYIAEIKNGIKNIIKNYDDDFYTTSPDRMREIMQQIIDTYPADEYSLIMTGHGNGSIIEADTTETLMTKLYAYGYDEKGENNSYSEKWINIPSLAAVFSNLKDKDNNPLHFEYIFFDCCCMQTVEVAYELRKYTDYIVASASEVPGKGAPYNTIVPILGNEKEDIGKNIIDNYISNTSWGNYGGIAISAVKTSEMQPLMTATKKALRTIYYDTRLTLDRSRCIYYYRGDETDDVPALHDIKHIMRINLSTEAFEEWLPYFENAVIYNYMPDNRKSSYWNSTINVNFYTMDLTQDNYGGIGMIAPVAGYDDVQKRATNMQSLNKTMFQLEWCNAIGWHELGW